MGTSQPEDLETSKTENFININQKIILPENYKKFSTIKLRIKPAKLIFLRSDNNSSNVQNLSSRSSGVNAETNLNKQRNFLNCERNDWLDPSYLFSSAESLPFMNEEFNNTANKFRTNQKQNRHHGGSGYKAHENNDRIINSELNEDSEIVKELVLDKFKDLLQKFIEKSNRRRMFSMDQKENLGVWSDYMHLLGPFTFDLHREVKNIRCPGDDTEADMNNSEKEISKEQLHEIHSEHQYFKNYGRGNMVSQENEISLKPQQPCNSKKEHTSSLVHISEPMERIQSIQFVDRKPETIVNHVAGPTNDYLTRKEENDGEIKLKDDINQQSSAIVQTLKVLSLCETNKKLFDSVLRVEAERVLLIATSRREKLMDELYKSNYGHEDEWNGFVLLSNIRIPLNRIDEKKIKKQISFFICVFRCGCTVFSSELLMPNREMELEIEDPVCFEELPTDFEITVEIYTMHLRAKEKASGVKILKKYKNALFGLRPRIRNTGPVCGNEESTTRKSAFTLIGSTSITKSELQFRELSIENKSTHNYIMKELKCTIDSGVKLDIFLSGFLMVCENCAGKTRWRRQWCILDASELKFWDYPGREESIAPNKIIDLSRSVLPYIMLADRKFCSRPRSLHLKIGPDSAQDEFDHRNIFLAADNPRDFLFWEQELNRVLKNLINWGCMRRYFENCL